MKVNEIGQWSQWIDYWFDFSINIVILILYKCNKTELILQVHKRYRWVTAHIAMFDDQILYVMIRSDIYRNMIYISCNHIIIIHIMCMYEHKLTCTWKKVSSHIDVTSSTQDNHVLTAIINYPCVLNFECSAFLSFSKYCLLQYNITYK